MSRSIVAKVWRMVREKGLRETVATVVHYVWEQTPWGQGPESEFDVRFGVDTGGRIPLRRLTVIGDNAEYGHRYQPIQPDMFAKLMSAVPTSLEGFTFVDLGSGKGRALLMASDHPFQKIVGVEFAEELHRVAVRNVEVYRNPAQRCRAIEPLLMDATAYPIPSGPVVIFIYNSFQAEVMARVVTNIQGSIRSDPRTVWILYYNPLYRDLFDACSELEVVKADPDFVIYRARAEARAAASSA